MRVPLDQLLPHPANPNVMSEELLTKLAANIQLENNYEPLTVRPHPEKQGCYQLLGGHQRKIVLERLGYRDAYCYVWHCNDQTALRLLVTLNRLEGRDDPLKRAELLRELTALASLEELSLLLPEDAAAIKRSIEMLDLDLTQLLDDLTRGAGPGSQWRTITFAVATEDEELIEKAVGLAMQGLEGANRRGQALGLICQQYLEAQNA